MISQVKIQNFQSHAETVLDLHEGVNALVGLTGAGKSVVFKALDWLFRNRPLGDEFHSWWGGNTQVELLLDSGQKVGRIRKYEERKGEWIKTDDYYYVDKKEFRAFGNGSPPQPVLEALNLSDINFQAQAAPSFLISNSSGEVARYLNKAAHLDVIDQALSNIASRLRGEKEDLSHAQANLAEAQDQLQQYDWLPRADEKLSSLEGLQERRMALMGQRVSLSILHDDLQSTHLELRGLDKVLSLSGEADKLLVLHDRIEHENEQWTALKGIADQHEKARTELDGLKKVEVLGSEASRLISLSDQIGQGNAKYALLEGTILSIEETHKAVDKYSLLPKAEAEWKHLDSLIREGTEFKKSSVELRSLIDVIVLTTSQLDQAENSKKSLESEFNKLMPNRCPLCEQEVSK